MPLKSKMLTTRGLIWRAIIAAVTGLSASAVFLLLCVPASSLALPSTDARMGLAMLCGVTFLFAVGFPMSGRWTFDFEPLPWRATSPSIRSWIVWTIDMTGTALIISSLATGFVLMLRSALA